MDKESLAHAVIEDQNERIVGGQERMLAKLDSLDGIRVWRCIKVAAAPRHCGLPILVS